MSMVNRLISLFKSKPTKYVIIVDDSRLIPRVYYDFECIIFPSLKETLARKESLETMYPLSKFEIYKYQEIK